MGKQRECSFVPENKVSVPLFFFVFFPLFSCFPLFFIVFHRACDLGSTTTMKAPGRFGGIHQQLSQSLIQTPQQQTKIFARKRKRATPCEHDPLSLLQIMARPAGIEPTTPWFVAKYSIQLSYGREEREYNTRKTLWGSGHPRDVRQLPTVSADTGRDPPHESAAAMRVAPPATAWADAARHPSACPRRACARRQAAPCARAPDAHHRPAPVAQLQPA